MTRERFYAALWIAVLVLAGVNLVQSIAGYRRPEARVQVLEECHEYVAR